MKYKSYFTEYTIYDFRKKASSLTREFRKKRVKERGRELKIARVVDFNKKDNILYILTEPTYNFNALIVPEGQANQKKTDNSYTMQIKFLDLDKYKENLTLPKFKELLNTLDVQLDCDCMAFHYQGMRYRLGLINSAIYKTDIPDKQWRFNHGKNGLLCKHLLGVIPLIPFHYKLIYKYITN